MHILEHMIAECWVSMVSGAHIRAVDGPCCVEY